MLTPEERLKVAKERWENVEEEEKSSLEKDLAAKLQVLSLLLSLLVLLVQKDKY